jgi:hypothetical protein
MDEPLIYTSKGNLPVASLKYAHSWEDTPEQITFVEEYSLDGEIVKRSAHVYLKKGLSAGVKQGAFGG